MRRPASRALFTLLTLLLVARVRAAEPRLDLAVEPDRVGMEDTFVATVTLEGSVAGLTEPQLELGSNFRVIATGRSHSISFVNGQTTVQVRFQFTVQPLHEGIFDVGPATVRHEQGDLRSGTARVQVVPGTVAERRAPSRNPWAPFGEPRRGTSVAPKLRVQATLDKAQVYVGEQVTYTLKLLTQQSVQSVKPRSEPAMTGLWAEPLEVPSPPRAERVTEGGEPYTAFLLKQTALFPTTAGTVKLEPAVWDIQVIVNDFLFGEAQTVAKASEPLELRVLPLPEAGKPPGFSGAVGDFKLEAALDKKETSVNEALLLRVTLAGTGNFKTLSPPPLPPLSDFRLYDSSSPPSESKKGRASGSRSWEWALVAKAPGQHTLPPLTYSFFDPARREYRTVTSAPLTIEVTKPAGEPDVPAAGAEGADPLGPRQAVKPVRRDIAYLKTRLERTGPRPLPLYGSLRFGLLLTLPVAANLAVLAWGLSRRLTSASGPAQRRRGARTAALARLKETEAALRKKQAVDVPSAVSEALRGFVADRFDQPRAGLTRARIEELLRESGVPAARVAEVSGLLGRADELGFSPREGRGPEMLALIGEARTRVIALDKALARKGRRP